MFFYFFAAITVFFSLCVISIKNPVHSVLSLIMAFLGAAGVFLTLGAEFISAIIVIVYVGAVAVLFLFAVMMLNFKNTKSSLSKKTLLFITVISTFFVLNSLTIINLIDIPKKKLSENNTQSIGEVLYTDYILHFQTCGMLLLLAIVGSISITVKKRKNTEAQKQDRRIIELVNVEKNIGI